MSSSGTETAPNSSPRRAVRTPHRCESDHRRIPGGVLSCSGGIGHAGHRRPRLAARPADRWARAVQQNRRGPGRLGPYCRPPLPPAPGRRRASRQRRTAQSSRRGRTMAGAPAGPSPSRHRRGTCAGRPPRHRLGHRIVRRHRDRLPVPGARRRRGTAGNAQCASRHRRGDRPASAAPSDEPPLARTYVRPHREPARGDNPAPIQHLTIRSGSPIWTAGSSAPCPPTAGRPTRIWPGMSTGRNPRYGGGWRNCGPPGCCDDTADSRLYWSWRRRAAMTSIVCRPDPGQNAVSTPAIPRPRELCAQPTRAVA